MRLYDIAFFIFLFNIALGIVSDLGVIPANIGSIGIGGQSATSFASSAPNNFVTALNTAQNQGISIQAVFSWFNVAFQLLMLIISPLINLFYYILLGTKELLVLVGVPDYIAWTLQALVWFIYAMGISQYMAGRSFREYQ